jgi:hypothetical protein
VSPPFFIFVFSKKYLSKRQKVGQEIVEGVDRHKILKNIKIYFVKVQKIGQGIVEGKKFAQIQKSLAQNAKKLANK